MLRNSVLTTCVVVALAIASAGCSDEFDHEDLTGKSPQFVGTQKMIDQLTSASPGDLDGVLARQIVPNLAANRDKGLRATLRQIARAAEVRLVSMDKWGDHVYRATITYTLDGAAQSATILLVPVDETLRWAGVN